MRKRTITLIIPENVDDWRLDQLLKNSLRFEIKEHSVIQIGKEDIRVPHKKYWLRFETLINDQVTYVGHLEEV